MMDCSLDALAALLAGSTGEADELPRACLMIASDEYPGLRATEYLDRLGGYAEELRGRLPPGCGAEKRIVELNRYLFAELGFSGNADDYYDPRNSYLNEVMDRRIGIPITLSVVYITLGRGIGLPLEGVSFPGHFLVRYRLRGGMIVLDPFSQGAPLAAEDLRERLKRVVPEGVIGSLAVDDLPLERFLEPASTPQILARVLRNLKGIYREAGRRESLLNVLNRMLVVAPDAHSERRDRGLLFRELECWRPALEDLDAYLQAEPDADDRGDLLARVAELRSLCARLN